MIITYSKEIPGRRLLNSVDQNRPFESIDRALHQYFDDVKRSDLPPVAEGTAPIGIFAWKYAGPAPSRLYSRRPFLNDSLWMEM